MPRINPDTLVEESDEGMQFRQRYTGVYSSGHSVDCRPVLEDRLVQIQQSRVVCLSRPHVACGICPHSTFTLHFKADQGEKYSFVACPRWDRDSSRSDDKDPDEYVMTEVATCDRRPYEFCPSCPSREDVQTIYSADKNQPGWYSRFKRLRKEEYETDE